MVNISTGSCMLPASTDSVVDNDPPSLVLQKEVVYKKKESIFSLEASEFRQPAVMTLQVWDYDRISANDFLGET